MALLRTTSTPAFSRDTIYWGLTNNKEHFSVEAINTYGEVMERKRRLSLSRSNLAPKNTSKAVVSNGVQFQKDSVYAKK